jgi:hypothetical protein
MLVFGHAIPRPRAGTYRRAPVTVCSPYSAPSSGGGDSMAQVVPSWDTDHDDPRRSTR